MYWSAKQTRARSLALACGLLFGAGLALSGMTDTDKVQGFLDIIGAWDITLLLVMCGALAVTMPGFQWARKRRRSLVEASASTHRRIDRKLLLGAVIFGVGWGLYGYCPGPAVASLVYGNLDSLLFVLAMLGGMQLHKLLTGR